ncbi:MAG: hypothetical protein OEW64_05375 [Gammaproteobacteria bacterium]|nr:hypothetical protein [Gammaproteobacteria bacterium]MDH5303510.1 hypothetical protein [Gammaproteobacteria bacterium]MDH5322791.1 hypothetical protein [Gammaproteobacteria bacterium]
MSSRRTSRRSLGVLLVAWLNLTMLPCALALGQAADSPGGPARQEQTDASHHGHASATQMPGCPTQVAELDCCDAVVLAIGDNGQKFDTKHSDNAAAFVAFDHTTLNAPDLQRHQHPSDAPDICSNSPRLHVFYCVYLD